MAFENKPGYGSLWPNKDKQKENQPDATGTFSDVDGKPMKIAAWKKVARNGQHYYSFKVADPARDQQGRGGGPRQAQAPVPQRDTQWDSGPDDDLPF